MLDQETMIPTVIVSGLTLMGLWAMFHWPYCSYRRDLLQNRLFELRQELFDLARCGAISFDHPAYGMLRTTINGFIKAGPQLNLVGTIFLLLIIKKHDLEFQEGYTDRFERLSEDLTDDTRRCLVHFRDKLNLYVFAHIFFTSLPVALLLWPIIALLRLVDGLRWLKPLWQVKFDRFDNAALVLGSGGQVHEGYARVPAMRRA